MIRFLWPFVWVVFGIFLLLASGCALYEGADYVRVSQGDIKQGRIPLIGTSVDGQFTQVTRRGEVGDIEVDCNEAKCKIKIGGVREQQ